MAIIGCLGAEENRVLFEVAPEVVRTLDQMKWSGTAKYGLHQRHAGNALTEFTGLGADQISLEIVFSPELGTNPMQEIWRLWRLMRKGTTLPLTIGTHAYGRYRWTITSMSVDPKYFDRTGEIYYAPVTLKLQEYLKD